MKANSLVLPLTTLLAWLAFELLLIAALRPSPEDRAARAEQQEQARELPRSLSRN